MAKATKPKPCPTEKMEQYANLAVAATLAVERVMKQPRNLKASILGDDIKAIDDGLNGLLLDLYPLTIANGSIDAGEQRRFADDAAAHIGAIRTRLVRRKLKVTGTDPRLEPTEAQRLEMAGLPGAMRGSKAGRVK